MECGTILYESERVLFSGPRPKSTKEVGRLRLVAKADGRGDLSGSLSGPAGGCITWSPALVSIEGGDCEERQREVVLPLEDVSSFRVYEEESLQHLVIIERDGKTHKPIVFADDDDRQAFIGAVSTLYSVRQSVSDSSLYLVTDPSLAELDESLSKLRLLDRRRDDSLWGFVREVKRDPYSAALSAFSKLTDKFIFSSASDIGSPDGVSSLMLQSFIMSNFEDNILTKPSDEDFEVIETRAKLIDDLDCRDRCGPVDQIEWDKYVKVDGSISQPEELRQRIFAGALEPCLRSEAWKFLLEVFPWSTSREERNVLRQQQVNDYFRMKLQWKSISKDQEKNFTGFRERKCQIEKDVVRTDRTIAFYEGDSNNNVQMLQEILMTYVMLDFDLGYVQGMSDLLAPILYVMRNEVDAFWCFVGFMRRVGDNFDLDHGGMKKQLLALHDLVKVTDPELYTYLVAKDSDNFFFCFRWLLIWFKREFNFEDIMKLWEILWTNIPCKNFHLLISVSLLHLEKSIIIENKFGFSEILKHINDKSQMIDMDLILQHAEALHRKLKSVQYVNNRIRQLLT